MLALGAERRAAAGGARPGALALRDARLRSAPTPRGWLRCAPTPPHAPRSRPRAAALAARRRPRRAHRDLRRALGPASSTRADNLAYRLALNTPGRRPAASCPSTRRPSAPRSPMARRSARWLARSPTATPTTAHARAPASSCSARSRRPRHDRDPVLRLPRTSSCCSIVEYWSFRHLEADGMVGYDLQATRGRRSRWGSATSSSTSAGSSSVLALYAVLYELAPLAPADRRVVGLGRPLLRRRLLLLLVPPRLAREPRLLGQPRRPPLQRSTTTCRTALRQTWVPMTYAAVLVAGCRSLGFAPWMVLLAQAWSLDLPVLDPHRAHRAAAAPDRGRCSTRRRTTASTTAPTSSTSTRTTAGSSIDLGPAVRHLGARGRARPLRVDHQHRDLQRRSRSPSTSTSRCGVTSGGRGRGARAGGSPTTVPAGRPAEEPELEPSSAARG